LQKQGTTKARMAENREYSPKELNSLFTVLKEVEL
jgi:hypothetical protein